VCVTYIIGLLGFTSNLIFFLCSTKKDVFAYQTFFHHANTMIVGAPVIDIPFNSKPYTFSFTLSTMYFEEKILFMIWKVISNSDTSFFKVQIQCLMEEVDNKPLDSMNTVNKKISVKEE
jgi:hypothetical protein